METTFSKLYEAIKPIETWSHTVDFGVLPAPQYGLTSDRRTMNLRIDVETPCHLEDRKQLYAVWNHVRHELIDLITFGDTDNYQDAFLKSLDGEVKHGRPANTIEFPGASIYREFRPTKSVHEYTVYLIIYLDFEETEDTK